MDLFNTLGNAIGNVDAARERADSAAIEALHGAEGYTEPQEYVVTVELTVKAYSPQDAIDLARIANRKAENIDDVLDTDVMEVEQL
jgi:hypothetical protein